MRTAQSAWEEPSSVRCCLQVFHLARTGQLGLVRCFQGLVCQWVMDRVWDTPFHVACALLALQLSWYCFFPSAPCNRCAG